MPTHKPSPQTAPIVGTRFVTNRNSVGFVRKKARTTSFVERGFERLSLSHQAVGFSWCSYMVKLFSPLESFSWRWAGRLWFLAIFPAPFFGALTFVLYSPSWMILALHLLVRQLLASVPVPSTVPSYSLLVAMIEVTLSNCLFSLACSGCWQGPSMRRGRISLDPISHCTSTWAPFHSHPLQWTSRG